MGVIIPDLKFHIINSGNIRIYVLQDETNSCVIETWYIQTDGDLVEMENDFITLGLLNE